MVVATVDVMDGQMVGGWVGGTVDQWGNLPAAGWAEMKAVEKAVLWGSSPVGRRAGGGEGVGWGEGVG